MQHMHAAAHVPQEQLCLPSQALSQELLIIVVIFRVEEVLITQFNQHVSWCNMFVSSNTHVSVRI